MSVPSQTKSEAAGTTLIKIVLQGGSGRKLRFPWQQGFSACSGQLDENMRVIRLDLFSTRQAKRSPSWHVKDTLSNSSLA